MKKKSEFSINVYIYTLLVDKSNMLVISEIEIVCYMRFLFLKVHRAKSASSWKNTQII